jgi:hypothetical protein
MYGNATVVQQDNVSDPVLPRTSDMEAMRSRSQTKVARHVTHINFIDHDSRSRRFGYIYDAKFGAWRRHIRGRLYGRREIFGYHRFFWIETVQDVQRS